MFPGLVSEKKLNVSPGLRWSNFVWCCYSFGKGLRSYVGLKVLFCASGRKSLPRCFPPIHGAERKNKAHVWPRFGPERRGRMTKRNGEYRCTGESLYTVITEAEFTEYV